MNKRLVVGNWKMNPQTLDEAKMIARKTRAVAAALVHAETVICPPATFIEACAPRQESTNFFLGAQSASIHDSGAHTGEIGADMLKDIGVKYVIAGHSETRVSDNNKNGDTDDIVSRRVKAILDVGLTPIVCVGEMKRDNENGSHFEFLRDQIKNSLANMPMNCARHIVLAYEPVWAIGATEAMDPAQIYEMSLFVKKVFSDVFSQESAMKATVLYGGSVNFRNVVDIINIGKVDGLLVGRESVNVSGFVELLKAVDGADNNQQR